MWYVYILKSRKDHRLYIGYTNDLRKRFDMHNNGLVFATKYRRPLNLVYYEAYLTKEDAKLREKKLKHFGSAYQELKKRVSELHSPG